MAVNLFTTMFFKKVHIDMNIRYTIKRGQIELSRRSPTIFNNKGFAINIEKSRLPLSIMQMSGEIDANCDISFVPAFKQGIVACFQLVKNPRLMEFNTSNCTEMIYHADILEVRFLTTDIPFRHWYTQGSIIKRLDIFFPLKSLEMLNHQIIFPILHDGHFSVDNILLKPWSKKIRSTLINVTDRINEGIGSTDVDKLIGIMNMMY